MAFDTIYALSDREDDRKLGINSSAIWLGDFAPQGIGGFYGLTALLLALLGITMHLGVFYFYSLILTTIGWGWHWYQLQSPTDYPQLFNQNVIFGFILLVGMILG
jgi:4-hydroxybenzoate polyprenyltransferase